MMRDPGTFGRPVRLRLWAERLIEDVRHTLRTLGRSPAFAAVVVTTLAMAIGMSTAIFSVFNAVMLRPLSYPHPERLVWLATVGPDEQFAYVTGPDFVEWRAQARAFDRLVAYVSGDLTLASSEGATRVREVSVTEDFWDLSAAKPIAGRLPRADEPDGVLLSERLVRRWLPAGRDPVGGSITLDGRATTVVGILPDTFRFEFPAAGFSRVSGPVDVYRPIAVSADRGPQIQLLNVVGRLAPDATPARAAVEIDTMRRRLAATQSHPMEDQRALRVIPLHARVIGAADQALALLLGAVALVLLIACANAANLLLARASARRREIAVRLSLGASRGRILVHLAIESLLLALAGGAAGLLLARLGLTAILRIDAAAIPRLAEATLDARVLGATLVTAMMAAFLFGLAPAAALWNMAPHEALKSSGLATSASAGAVRARRFLVAGEVALALVLLIGSGLLVKSAWRLHAYPAGFEPARVLSATLQFAGPQYAEPPRQIAFVRSLLERLRAQPGVTAVSFSTHGSSLAQALMFEGDQPPAPEDRARNPPLMINATSAALKDVMGFRLLRGRWFADGEAAVVLNESLARREGSGRDPIGRRITLAPGGPPLTIVGIVADVRYTQLDAPAEAELYVPFTHADGLFELTVLSRTRQDPRALASNLRNIVKELDPTQALGPIDTLEQVLADSIAPRRLNLFLLGAFAGTALLLAMIGVYGVTAWAVTQRGREIGIRMALGARRADVVRLVVQQGMRVTLAGIVIGVAGSLALSQVMEGLLYDVRPTDPLTFAVLAAGLASTGLLACSVPALRAARVDPVVTLRHE
jgi:putative ABC transport system permease protein